MSQPLQPLHVAGKLIQSHLVSGEMRPDTEIGLRIDQTLTQDATGTLVMLELEAMGLDRVRTEVSVQYIDHNLLQTDHKNPDDHLFLLSACRRFGIWFSRAGNGVSHPVHMERFGVPGKSLAGSDSHTPAAGALGMLAFGSGGLDVAFAMAGEPLFLKMPRVLGVELTGTLPDWVSAKDAVLELLRRYDVDGCRGYIIEYYGPGLKGLSAMDRHVMANMGTEMGATTTVFPSDGETRRFLESQGRGDAWTGIEADPGAVYDKSDRLNLSTLEPLIALPGSPGNVRPVRDVRGRPIYQAYIGSSANPGLRDFRVAAAIVKNRLTHPEVSFDINPSTRQVLENMTISGALGDLLGAGARLHQTGCNGCIGMGQAPATGRISLRTVPRNFPGRSGTREDQVYLCSPETAAASALTGEITDPRDLESLVGMAYPRIRPMEKAGADARLLTAPPPAGRNYALEKGPNIKALPAFPPMPDSFRVPVILKMGDDISTDEILRAGAEALPFRSNIPAISRWAYAGLIEDFPGKARQAGEAYGGHLVVAGSNYAQGSSREHAALAPRYLGQIAVIAKSYARIGWQNLVNFGILPLEFRDAADYDDIVPGNVLSCHGLRRRLSEGLDLVLRNETLRRDYAVMHRMSPRQVEIMLAGGVIGWFKSLPAREAAREEALTGH
jgi:aconitate hydratase